MHAPLGSLEFNSGTFLVRILKCPGRPGLPWFVALLLLIPTAALAGQRAAADSLKAPPGRPVKVEVSVDLVEISQMQDHDQKFEIEFYVHYAWNDPRLAFDAAAEGRRKKVIPADDVWTPEPQLRDELDVNVSGGKAVHVHPGGRVLFSQYYRGTISSSFDLHEFPLDKHALEVALEATIYENDEVEFVAGEALSVDSERAAPHGWKLLGLSCSTGVSSYPRTAENYSLFKLKIDVERDPHFYFWSIVLPLIPIVATSWSVFWMDPKEFSSQVGVGITAMLTVVAYRITIDSSLPPLAYMTRMDYFLLVCQIFVFGAFVASVVGHVFTAQESESGRLRALRLNANCRWTPPLVLLAVSLALYLLPPVYGTWVISAAVAATLLMYVPALRKLPAASLETARLHVASAVPQAMSGPHAVRRATTRRIDPEQQGPLPPSADHRQNKRA